MQIVTLGKTGITSIKNGFGALPIQRVNNEYAVMLLRRAMDAGFTFFDTARAYSDSEHKLGLAFSDVRDRVTIATKTGARTGDGLMRDLETSLQMLRTDHVDLYQLHNPAFCPKPGDGTGLYEALCAAKEQGMIRHIGITNHRPDVAREAILSGLYETLQFPFSYLATQTDLSLVELAARHDVGFIAMKALCGGLLTHADAAFAFLAQYPNVLPIFGIQRREELDEFISYHQTPPTMTEQIQKIIARDRDELLGDFCRGCGYCMPCPVGIEINNCARMAQLIRRSPSANWLTSEQQAKMMKIEACLHCGACRARCPYGLDTPALLSRNLEDYKNILSGKVSVLPEQERR